MTGEIDGKPKDIMAIYITMYNNSDSVLHVYRNKGVFINDSGKKVRASVINSDDLGGEIKPKEFKHGVVVFPLSSKVFYGTKSLNIL